jgi:hypothetical protein
MEDPSTRLSSCLLRWPARVARAVVKACRSTRRARAVAPTCSKGRPPLCLEVLELRDLPSAISDAAVPAVLQRVNDAPNTFFVYRDADSGANHGFASGKFASNTDPALINGLVVDPAAVNDPNSPGGVATGAAALDRVRGTVLRISFPALATGQFVGLNIEDPEFFGERRTGVGYDLRGATAIVLEVRSPTPGGLRVQFGLGGKVTDFNNPVLITDSFQTITIPLAALRDPNTNAISPPDLSNVQLLFSVATNSASAPGGGTILLDNIRLTPTPANPTGAIPLVSLPRSVATFGVVPATTQPIPLDQVLGNLTTVYESTLVGFGLLARGTTVDLAGARRIAEALVYALQHDNEGAGLPIAPDGSRGLHDGYSDGALALLNDQDALTGKNGKRGQVRLAGFTADPALGSPNGFYLVQDGATGGNNAFAVMYLVDAYRRFGDVRYLTAAREIGNWIVGNLTDTSGTGYGGYFVGYAEGGGTSTTRQLLLGKSVENNADIFAGFMRLASAERELGNTAQANLWEARATVAGDFVMAMYTPGDPNDSADGHFFAGTLPVGTTPAPGLDPSGPQRGNDIINRFLFLDSDSFPILALAGSELYRNAIDWREPTRHMIQTFAKSAQATTGGQVRTFAGFSLVVQPTATLGRPTPGADGVAWEFTGQAVAVMRFVDQLYGESNFAGLIASTLNQIRQAQTSAPFTDGSTIPASTLHGENDDGSGFAPVDQGLTTPFQVIPERPALAATLWGIFADLGTNLFDPTALPTVVITASDATAGERGVEQTADPGQFTLTRQNPARPLVVNYTLTGTAVNGRDFVTLPGQVTFAPGAPTATIDVNVLNNSIVDGTRAVTVNLAPGTDYTFADGARATVLIADNDATVARRFAAAVGGSISVYDNGLTPTATFPAFPGFPVGIAVATGDVNGDGIADVAASVASGGPAAVRVFDGATGAERLTFFVLGPGYTGGTSVALGDTNGDGRAELIVGLSAGIPAVGVFDGLTGGLMSVFLAYPGAPVGVTVAAGDVDGDGKAEIVTGPTGIAPLVRVFDGTGGLLNNLLAFSPALASIGVRVGAADLDGDGRAEVLASAIVNGTSFVLVYNGDLSLRTALLLPPATGSGPGVPAVGADLNGDGAQELLVTVGPVLGAFDGRSFALLGIALLR